MSELSSAAAPKRRQRAEARRSVAAILDAAVNVLNRNPQANMADVAKAAGVTRQTVYAHYPTREVLVSAAIDHATQHAVAAMDAADLDSGSPLDALLRLAEAGWQLFERYPLLLAMSSDDADADRGRHQFIRSRMERLIERGQATGDFDSRFRSDWLVTAAIAIGHAAGEQVTAGRMTNDDGVDAVRRSMLKLLQHPERRS